MTPTLLPAGDSAIVFQLGETISPDINERIIALADALEAARTAGRIRGIVELVPTYRSLLVTYDPETIRGADLGARLLEINDSLGAQIVRRRLLTVPALYGGPVGMDLDALAEMKGLTTEEVIALHLGAEYRVYMVGFAPGFAYLGGLPEVLHTPRLREPRQLIPAGALGIGGQQASVSSVAGPSGWRFLGWTPVRAFAPESPEPFLFRAGDRVRFRRIDRAEADALEAAQARGEPIVEIEDPAR